MIKNPHLLDKVNRNYLKQNQRTYKEALVIFEALWQEAVHQGALPLKNAMEGLEKDFRIANALNHPQLKNSHV